MNIDIKARLESIRSTLADGVTLVAVSKFHPLEALREAYDAGQRFICYKLSTERPDESIKPSTFCSNSMWLPKKQNSASRPTNVLAS